MSYKIDDIVSLTPREIGSLCKENNVKSYTTKTLEEIISDLNINKDKKKVTKTSNKPNESAKENQNEEMKGGDNTIYVSTKNAKGAWYWKKKDSDSKVEILADHSSECSSDKRNANDSDSDSDNDYQLKKDLDSDSDKNDSSDEDVKPKKITTKKTDKKTETKTYRTNKNASKRNRIVHQKNSSN